MPPSWQAVPAGIRNGHSEGGPFFFATTTMRCRRAHLPSASRSFPGVSLQRFPSLGLKSRIDARKRVFSRVFLQRFPSLALKSRITADFGLFPGESLQRLPNSPHQIKNHCTQENVFRQKPAVIPKFTPSNQESLQCKRRFQAKTCSDSQVRA